MLFGAGTKAMPYLLNGLPLDNAMTTHGAGFTGDHRFQIRRLTLSATAEPLLAI